MFPMNLEISILQEGPIRLLSVQLDELDYGGLYR